MYNVPIQVINITPRCLTGAAGEKLLHVMQPQLEQGASVCLDFTGITMFASLFFNNSITKLLKDFSPENIKERVRIINLNETGKKALARSLEVGGVFYNLTSEQKDRVEEIVKRSLSLWQ